MPTTETGPFSPNEALYVSPIAGRIADVLGNVQDRFSFAAPTVTHLHSPDQHTIVRRNMGFATHEDQVRCAQMNRRIIDALKATTHHEHVPDDGILRVEVRFLPFQIAQRITALTIDRRGSARIIADPSLEEIHGGFIDLTQLEGPELTHSLEALVNAPRIGSVSTAIPPSGLYVIPEIRQVLVNNDLREVTVPRRVEITAIPEDRRVVATRADYRKSESQPPSNDTAEDLRVNRRTPCQIEGRRLTKVPREPTDLSEYLEGYTELQFTEAARAAFYRHDNLPEDAARDEEAHRRRMIEAARIPSVVSPPKDYHEILEELAVLDAQLDIPLDTDPFEEGLWTRSVGAGHSSHNTHRKVDHDFLESAAKEYYEHLRNQPDNLRPPKRTLFRWNRSKSKPAAGSRRNETPRAPRTDQAMTPHNFQGGQREVPSTRRTFVDFLNDAITDVD